MRPKIVLLLVRSFLQGVKPFQTYFARMSIMKKHGMNRFFTILLMLVLAFSFLILEGMLAVNFYIYQTLGALMGFPYLGVFLSCLVGFFFLFIFSLTGVSSVLYRSKDVSLLMTLPLHGSEIVCSRMVVAYGLYGGIYALIVVPALVSSVFVQGFSFMYLMGSLFLLVIGPLLPLSLGMFFSSLLLRLAKGKQLKLLEEVFSTVCLLGFFLLMMASFTRNVGENSLVDVDYQAMMMTLAPLLEDLIAQFAFFSFQSSTLYSTTSLVLNLVASLLVSFLVFMFISKGYQHSFSLVLSSKNSRLHAFKKGGVQVRTKNQSLMMREIECVKSHSVFVFELVGELLVPLILIGVYAVTGVLGELEGVVELVASSPYFMYGIFFAMALFSNMSMLSSTSVSRQGSLFVLDKALPLSAKDLVRAKLSLHIVLVYIPNIIYLTLALLYFDVELVNLLWMACLSFFIIITCAALSLAVDYSHPVLDWTLPQQAMKSNLNGLLGLLISLVTIVMFAVVLLGPVLLGLPGYIAFALTLLLGLGGSYWSVKVCIAKASGALCR
ncbi:MAG: hypothetical protein PHO09_01635 [Sphaerochaeta sp.]|nr:hypothetical protein [Sphaerochaeta sp.]